ncbi:PREDICTED: zinc transporter 3 isoform X2 [Hipposideros armiger]|uniref:Probable proton-coupled zinc antiporter SLC30A3 n=1 Tax=Hipposideros armiger TaxID=186990 RepID=A0A8B7QWI3_HIPAR|nr:PREDICTED: zinc transporter 3 isoform X2 [Hipposideros armiger]
MRNGPPARPTSLPSPSPPPPRLASLRATTLRRTGVRARCPDVCIAPGPWRWKHLAAQDWEPHLQSPAPPSVRPSSGHPLQRWPAVDTQAEDGPGLQGGLFTEPSEPFPEEPKAVEMPSHHCHRDPLPQLGLTPERLQAQRQLCAACAVCCVFMAGEVVGGYLAHSLAIMTDAAHLLADVGSMMGSLFSLWLSTRPATRTMTFGWHRSETLGALASVVSLWMVTGILLYLAFIRLLHSDYHIEGGAMLLTASIAVCANLLMAFVLHQAGPPHSHGSRGAEYAPLEEGPGEPLPLRNTSVRAAFVHVLGDLLQSFGVLAASILIYFKPQYKAADPISTFLFSICALGSTAPTLRDVLRVLMEGSPKNVGFEPVRDTLLSVPGVRATHELHLWSLTLTYHVASAHLAIDSTADPEAVLAEATSQLHSRFGFSSSTLQVEQYQPEMAQCLRCREPPQS